MASLSGGRRQLELTTDARWASAEVEVGVGAEVLRTAARVYISGARAGSLIRCLSALLAVDRGRSLPLLAGSWYLVEMVADHYLVAANQDPLTLNEQSCSGAPVQLFDELLDRSERLCRLGAAEQAMLCRQFSWQLLASAASGFAATGEEERAAACSAAVLALADLSVPALSLERQREQLRSLSGEARLARHAPELFVESLIAVA